ncbi:hypothetical protein ACQPW1_38620 [Nocardia sp. CA-128927]|uniref:hypothetical protein n=1 Tax=Nocardia sp. CA-128927 TaxID=3239975 RepID=UPI003D982E60
MLKDGAVQAEGGVAMIVARMADGVAAEWKWGQQWLATMWSRRDEPVAKELPIPSNAEDLLLGLDPLIAVRWRGSR